MKKELKKQSKDKQILKKHVAAIHIGAKLSLLQRKLVNALLYNAYEGLLTSREHQINASVLCEMIGFDSNNTNYLKASLKGLMETVVEFDVLEDDGKSSWEAMVLLPYVKLKDGVCTYRYEQALAEKLYHPDVYSKINLSVLRDMNSAHALVLYENCYRYVDIAHTPWWDVDVFRKLMSVDQMISYKQFKLLNRAVIQPAMKEVNELSNIQLELETKRKGRTVTGLRFIIRPNPQLSLVGMDSEDDVTQMPSYQALLAEGISKTLARAWALEHDEQYIFEKLDLASSQAASGKIRSSKAGFLKSAIEEDYHNEDAQKKKTLEAAQDRKSTREKLERKLEALKTTQREAETSYRWHTAEIIEEAFQRLSEDEREAVTAEFQLSLGSSIYASAFKKGGWKDRLTFPDIKKFWEARGVSLPSPAVWAQKKGSQEPDIIKAQIDELEEQLKQPVKLVKSK
ncbi:replication initiation protein (plasmid) [Sulfitobacter sp. S223]|uniref:replication initiation protein n=1 Tax=Sulfitobacter sp. S223 TaxID=2867023 RepID=UPI0021A2D557|nr:replication initiation protein [Sulfitobacter sp. S223]UWR28319.1 replication initiation protein [Sulfitobacter sp. S223]